MSIHPPPDLSQAAQPSNPHYNPPASEPIVLNSESAHTWSERNPQKDLQPLRLRAKATEASRATRRISAAANKVAKTALAAAILELVALRQSQLVELANTHNVTVAHIEKLVGSSTHYKHTRAPSIRNALVHKKGVELNEGKEAGERASLATIQSAIAEDSDYEHMSKNDQQSAIDKLVAFRLLNSSAARTTNRSAARDVDTTMRNVQRELHDLSDRTGVYFMTWVTRGHIDDLSQPTWFASDDAPNFLTDILSLNAWDILRQFEQWACAKSKNAVQRETIYTIRARCVKDVQAGLMWAIASTSKKGIAMNYVNINNFIQTHKVKIVGWPLKDFVNPALITNLADIRTLRDAWASGAARWVRLSASEVKKHLEEVEERRESGEVVGKKRKRRSDAGKPKGKRLALVAVESDGDDGQGNNEVGGTKKKIAWPRKAAKTVKPKGSQLPPKSKEFITESDESSDG